MPLEKIPRVFLYPKPEIKTSQTAAEQTRPFDSAIAPLKEGHFV